MEADHLAQCTKHVITEFGTTKHNLSSHRKEDLNPGPLDLKSSALKVSTKAPCLYDNKTRCTGIKGFDEDIKGQLSISCPNIIRSIQGDREMFSGWCFAKNRTTTVKINDHIQTISCV